MTVLIFVFLPDFRGVYLDECFIGSGGAVDHGDIALLEIANGWRIRVRKVWRSILMGCPVNMRLYAAMPVQEKSPHQ